jgi:hypothetical protein
MLFVTPLLVESLNTNRYFIATSALCCFLLAKYSGSSFLTAAASLVYVSFVGYVVHAFAHQLNFVELLRNCANPFLRQPVVYKPLMKFCEFLDFHEGVHHDTAVNREWKNVLAEFVMNFFTQGGFLILAILFLRQVNLYVVLLWALAYCTIHNINYDLLRPESHKRHHENKNTNFGIDPWDIFFCTKAEGDPVENINHYSYNMLFLTACILVALA